ncbi:hypothetical protein [Nocardioides jishulii]|uniref:Uncharacterized protein n=1 Tax=Nocardioides jishulii TaxID=2575440 RepID=A0A4U2YU58_9ACTN|nr:hypothetical protein [Nocardioides jishulii]QCX28861.1 hypothetical protein FCL41_16025 [Nocardioides jishulii]TKI64242.1 hypothetical protein FC770_03540 [Nocardioides jishulii]
MPAITLATSAPAYAASSTMACQVVALNPVAAWIAAGGGVTRNVDTGWYVPGTYAPESGTVPAALDGFVKKSEADWYTSLNLPSGSFLSFGNTRNAVASATASNATTTVTLTYTFTVQNKVTLDLGGRVLFGYGNSPSGKTERQYVQIDVKGLAGGDRTVARMAPRRQSADGSVLYPHTSVGISRENSATAGNHRLLKQSDAQLEALGYTLHTPPSGIDQGRFSAYFADKTIVDDASGSRVLQIVYTLTLPARYDSSWVNDDVILFAPTVRVNC